MRILVYGAGKTGTTAVYYAFKNALPGITAVFEPSDLGKLNIPAHPKMLVKSLALIRHAQDAPHFHYFDKKILIVRHPFDRLVSYVLYAPNNGYGFFDDRKMAKFHELLQRKLSSPREVSFREIVSLVGTYQPSTAGMYAPIKMLETIAETYPDFHLLRYEDFVAGRLEAINRYSGLELTSDPEIAGNEQKVARSKSYGEWHDWFLQEDLDHFREVYGSYLDRFGYDVTLQNPEPLNERTTVAYSIKVANQGRRARWLPEYKAGEVNMTGEGVQYQRAQHALGQREFDRADEIIEKVLATNNRIAGFHYLKSQVLAAKGDHAAAVASLRQAIGIAPAEPLFHRLLGTALVKNGHQSEGDAAFKIARELRQRVAS